MFLGIQWSFVICFGIPWSFTLKVFGSLDVMVLDQPSQCLVNLGLGQWSKDSCIWICLCIFVGRRGDVETWIAALLAPCKNCHGFWLWVVDKDKWICVNMECVWKWNPQMWQYKQEPDWFFTNKTKNKKNQTNKQRHTWQNEPEPDSLGEFSAGQPSSPVVWTSCSKVFVNFLFKSICQLLIQKYLSTSGLPSSPPLRPPRCLVSVQKVQFS